MICDVDPLTAGGQLHMGTAGLFILPLPPGLITILFLKNFIYLIYLFLAALGLRCCAWAFSSCGERGLLLVAVRRLLIAVASLVAEHGL